MRDFDVTPLTDALKPTSSNPWLIFLDVVKGSNSLHFVRNPVDITLDSTTYTASNFEISAIPAKLSGELPSITIKVLNTREFIKEVELYNGYIDYDVTIYYVYYDTAYLTGGSFSLSSWPFKFLFKITNYVVEDNFITFNLGVPDYLSITVPRRLYRKDSCPFRYKSPDCWMHGKTVPTGTNDSCDHTLQSCQAHFDAQKASNPSFTIDYLPFGGFPTIGTGTLIYR